MAYNCVIGSGGSISLHGNQVHPASSRLQGFGTSENMDVLSNFYPMIIL